MNKRLIGIGAAAALCLVAVVGATRWFGSTERAAAQATGAQGPRVVSVEVGTATKKRVPLLLQALGNVTTIASVAIKARIDNEIVGIHFADGARVREGDLLVTLDTRAIEAQIKQAEGNIAKDQAQLEGAERDVRRYTELVAKHATPVVNLDNAKTQADTFRAAMKANQAALENLNVLLSYCSIRAPISGRIGAATMKVGNFVRSADTTPIAVINQIAPVYVTFTVPQKNLPDIRQAIASETATVDAISPGETRRAQGRVTMIENTIDQLTGMATVRATMPNEDELLWPGTLVTVQITLRVEDAVVVPAAAIQVSQTGSFVFVVKDGAAVVQPVNVARSLDNEVVIGQGLDGGETVVTDGHLLLTNGARVSVRGPRTGA